MFVLVPSEVMCVLSLSKQQPLRLNLTLKSEFPLPVPLSVFHLSRSSFSSPSTPPLLLSFNFLLLGLCSSLALLIKMALPNQRDALLSHFACGDAQACGERELEWCFFFWSSLTSHHSLSLSLPLFPSFPLILQPSLSLSFHRAPGLFFYYY